MTVVGTGAKFELGEQYGQYGDGYAPSVLASGSAQFTAQPSDGDILTIDDVPYRFKTTIVAANDIAIGANLPATLANLLAGTQGLKSGSGTQYFAGTEPQLRTTCGVGSQTFYITSAQPGLGGNAIVLTKTSTHINLFQADGVTVGAGTLTGAVHGGFPQYAYGAIGLIAQPSPADTFHVGSTLYTYQTTAAGAGDVQIGSDLWATALAVFNALTGNDAFNVTPNAAIASVVLSNNVVSFTASTTGTAGNSTALTTSAATKTDVSAATLLGGQAAIPFDTTTILYRPMRVTRIDYSMEQIESVYPQETGIFTPTGVYKGGYYVQGSATLHPRLTSDLGWLLLLAMGQCTTVVSGSVATHTFKYQTNQSETPWGSVRVLIPGRNNVPAQGLIGYDNKISAVRFNLRPAAPLEAECDWIGSSGVLDNFPQGWIEQDNPEEFQGVPITSIPAFGSPAANAILSVPLLAGNAIPMLAARLEIRNNLTGPREGITLGRFTMDDILILNRLFSLEFTFKWNSPELYQRAYAGVKGGTQWSPTPFLTNTSGSQYAFDLKMQSPFFIPNTTTPYSLEIRANEAWIAPRSGMRLEPGQIVTQDYMATVINPLSPNTSYADVILVNGNTAGYTLPTEP